MAGKIYLCLVDCQPDVNGMKPYCREGEEYIFPDDWEPPNSKAHPPKFRFLRKAQAAEEEEPESSPSRSSGRGAKGTVNGRRVGSSKKAAAKKAGPKKAGGKKSGGTKTASPAESEDDAGGAE